MKFQQKLDEMMNKNFVTNYRLAKSIGVHQTTVSNWRKGNQMPQLMQLGKIAEFFGCTVDELLKE